VGKDVAVIGASRELDHLILSKAEVGIGALGRVVDGPRPSDAQPSSCKGLDFSCVLPPLVPGVDVCRRVRANVLVDCVEGTATDGVQGLVGSVGLLQDALARDQSDVRCVRLVLQQVAVERGPEGSHHVGSEAVQVEAEC
jgi:hypothetical protein